VSPLPKKTAPQQAEAPLKFHPLADIFPLGGNDADAAKSAEARETMYAAELAKERPTSR
jgi:hypothetical protein